ncbi:hypothetical protein M440DRAFT_198556 [Trichoderma longibrachiatum ATCC 18648]|uniref:Uncharacterized protein n=1 Tax=Trichoderma longibrachiatum ATCC 18648 TaxID=983965 RepID=A0A2T4CGC1_TRILO|nr:hypothetical protein M440DRAFT_198556 [Trichoderma longibrachiatum ATCC 18648]
MTTHSSSRFRFLEAERRGGAQRIADVKHGKKITAWSSLGSVDATGLCNAAGVAGWPGKMAWLAGGLLRRSRYIQCSVLRTVRDLALMFFVFDSVLTWSFSSFSFLLLLPILLPFYLLHNGSFST